MIMVMVISDHGDGDHGDGDHGDVGNIDWVKKLCSRPKVGRGGKRRDKPLSL